MTNIREIASGLEFPEGPVAMSDGSILVVEIHRGTLSRVLPNGAVSVVAELGGGPGWVRGSPASPSRSGPTRARAKAWCRCSRRRGQADAQVRAPWPPTKGHLVAHPAEQPVADGVTGVDGWVGPVD